jgi:tetratricopeptide (TPR) repeat protein
MRHAALRLLTMFAVAFLVLCQIHAGSPVLADQRDGRLDALFERLQETSDPVDAAAIQQQIWQIWIESDDAASNQLMRRGMAAMASGDPDSALDAFDELVTLAPDFAEAWNKRATVYYLMGRLDESVTDIQQTLELEPRHFGALSGLALIYDAVEEPEAAIRSLEAALEINPHLHGSRDRLRSLREKMKGTRT